MLDKFKITCLIDDKILESDKGYCIPKLSRYLKNTHNTNLEAYVKKYYYNNKAPECACGCKEKVNFHKGIYMKYFQDHKNYTSASLETRIKISEKNKAKNTLEYRLIKNNKTKKELTFMYDLFINYTNNLTDICLKYKIDKRTLKKFWFDLFLIKDIKEFENVCRKHQKIWGNKNNTIGGKQLIDENVLLDVYCFLTNNKHKYTLNEICSKFNIPTSPIILFKRLSENFGEELIKDLTRHGLSSRVEMEFYNILKYYFGKKIKKGFTISGKFYDFILDNRILIEYDGDYWHSLLKNIENDKIKDELAIKNNYIIFRVKDSECKDINIINKLYNLYENKIK
jgi:hypothetical protein